MLDRADYFQCPVCNRVSCEPVVVKGPNGSLYTIADRLVDRTAWLGSLRADSRDFH